MFNAWQTTDLCTIKLEKRHLTAVCIALNVNITTVDK
jgi:hypothetical protein